MEIGTEEEGKGKRRGKNEGERGRKRSEKPWW